MVVEVLSAVVTLLVVAAIYELVRRRRRPADAPDYSTDRPADDPLVKLRGFRGPAEADVVRGLLMAHGIPAVLSTDSADGWGSEGLIREPYVLVRESDAEHARELIAAEPELA